MRLPISPSQLGLEYLGSILHRFRDVADFCAHGHTPYSTLISGVFPLDQIADVGVSPIINLKLISREIFQPM